MENEPLSLDPTLDTMHIDLPPAVLPLFEAAGPHRPPDSLPGIPTDHPAFAILSRFDGAHVGECGRGEECATSDIAFGADPDHQAMAEVLHWERLLGTRLIQVAEVHHGHGLLLVGGDGTCYGMSLVHDAFWFEGASFGEAVERLLLGRKGQPMLRPGQASVSMHGETFKPGHPGLHRDDLGD